MFYFLNVIRSICSTYNKLVCVHILLYVDIRSQFNRRHFKIEGHGFRLVFDKRLNSYTFLGAELSQTYSTESEHAQSVNVL